MMLMTANRHHEQKKRLARLIKPPQTNAIFFEAQISSITNLTSLLIKASPKISTVTTCLINYWQTSSYVGMIILTIF